MKVARTNRGKPSPRGRVAARRADGRGANKSLVRNNLSVHFFVTGQRNEPKKARLGALPLSTPDCRPLPVRIACGQAAQFAGAGGIQRQTNLCFRRLEMRTATSEKLTRTGFEALSDLLGENSQRFKPRCARIWNWGEPSPLVRVAIATRLTGDA